MQSPTGDPAQRYGALVLTDSAKEMNVRRLSMYAFICLLLLMPATTQAGFLDSIMDTVSGKSTGGGLANTGLDNAEIVDGIKEALSKGTERTVSRTGQTNGYWKNDHIRIPMPESLATATKVLNGIGMGSLTEDLHMRMNRAAEAAAPLARPIFLDAITDMDLSDAQKIWKGPDDAATRYFEGKTSEKLRDAFRPVVSKELERAKAIKSYQDIAKSYADVPFVGQKLNLDMDTYVTDNALDGLFFMLAKEEAEIRNNPAARTTDILKRVFK